ncbi:TPA: hypothetical protein ACHSON_004669 [Raoultella planticola ATCC 33531]
MSGLVIKTSALMWYSALNPGGTARESKVDGKSVVRRRAGESLRSVMTRRLIQ